MSWCAYLSSSASRVGRCTAAETNAGDDFTANEPSLFSPFRVRRAGCLDERGNDVSPLAHSARRWPDARRAAPARTLCGPFDLGGMVVLARVYRRMGPLGGAEQRATADAHHIRFRRLVLPRRGGHADLQRRREPLYRRNSGDARIRA